MNVNTKDVNPALQSLFDDFYQKSQLILRLLPSKQRPF
jgi:hypothetical protein